MSDTTNNGDPMEFIRKMWGGAGFPMPGMIVPTLDTDELEKRITDLKAVEGWLKMNLTMLQMHIQGLEMQHSTLTAMRNAGQAMSEEAANMSAPLSNPALWPWSVMQQAAAAAAAAATPTDKKDKT